MGHGGGRNGQGLIGMGRQRRHGSEYSQQLLHFYYS
jgi:hypothetical protein